MVGICHSVEGEETMSEVRVLTAEEMIGQAIGEASMCWEPIPTGVFDATKAKVVMDRLIRVNEAEKETLRAALEKAEEALQSCGNNYGSESADNGIYEEYFDRKLVDKALSSIREVLK